jgi:hypothetical protein
MPGLYATDDNSGRSTAAGERLLPLAALLCNWEPTASPVAAYMYQHKRCTRVKVAALPYLIMIRCYVFTLVPAHHVNSESVSSIDFVAACTART